MSITIITKLEPFLAFELLFIYFHEPSSLLNYSSILGNE